MGPTPEVACDRSPSFIIQYCLTCPSHLLTYLIFAGRVQNNQLRKTRDRPSAVEIQHYAKFHKLAILNAVTFEQLQSNIFFYLGCPNLVLHGMFSVILSLS